MFSLREPTQPVKVMKNINTPTTINRMAGSTDRQAIAASEVPRGEGVMEGERWNREGRVICHRHRKKTEKKWAGDVKIKRERNKRDLSESDEIVPVHQIFC